MVAVTRTLVEFNATPCGGFEVDLTRDFPRSDLDAHVLPHGTQKVVVRADTDQDGVADQQYTVPLRFIDKDRNGVLERETGDTLLMRIDAAAVIQDGVACQCGPAERRSVAERVYRMLGGI